MWGSKLKSRNSFLAILEFINVPRAKFRKILVLMQPGGIDFHKKYIRESHQFDTHDIPRLNDFRTSETVKVGVENPANVRPGWFYFR